MRMPPISHAVGPGSGAAGDGRLRLRAESPSVPPWRRDWPEPEGGVGARARVCQCACVFVRGCSGEALGTAGEGGGTGTAACH